jgi:hypothetical protein
VIGALIVLASLGLAPAAPAPPVALRYAIDAELQPSTYRLKGQTDITWLRRDRGVRELRLQLFLNAWRDAKSTWMRRSTAVVPRDVRWGGIDIGAISVRTAAWSRDLTASARYIAPDDGNADDRTVLQVDLPEPIGESDVVSIHLQWTAAVPSYFGETGARGRYFFVPHSSPQLCDVDSAGWVCPQADPSERTPAETADYTVRLTTPSEWTVGASGRTVARSIHDDRATYEFQEHAIRRFAWTASPDFVDIPARIPATAPLDVRLLLQPEHRAQSDRFLRAIEASIVAYRAFGPFPFDHLTIVDPAWQTHGGGSGYPGLVTAAAHWLTTDLDGSVERDIARGVARQWWGNLVAIDPARDAVTASALADYAQARVVTTLLNRRRQTEAFGFYSRRFFSGFVPWVSPTVPLREPFDDRPGDRSSALAFATIERYVGWPAMQQALAAVVERYANRTVRREQVFDTMAAAIGQDLSWFFRQVFERPATFDYAVTQLTTEPQKPELCRAAAPCVQSRVTVNRLGDGVFSGTSEQPVGSYQAGRALTILVRFADGSSVVERWDGRAASSTFEYESRTAAMSAQIDPDRVLLLDRHVVNNSITREAAGPAFAARWSARWAIWLQDLLLSWATLV